MVDARGTGRVTGGLLSLDTRVALEPGAGEQTHASTRMRSRLGIDDVIGASEFLGEPIN